MDNKNFRDELPKTLLIFIAVAIIQMIIWAIVGGGLIG
jgi:hypothetical protein